MGGYDLRGVISEAGRAWAAEDLSDVWSQYSLSTGHAVFAIEILKHSYRNSPDSEPTAEVRIALRVKPDETRPPDIM